MSPRFSFIQTSDFHIDGEFEWFEDFAPKLRDTVLETFNLVISLTRRENVDALLIAGDLFDEKTVRPETLDFIQLQFEKLNPIKVYISPGNFDPYHAQSPYYKLRWSPNVHIFREPRFTPVKFSDNVIIHGYAHGHDSENISPITNYRVQKEQEGEIHILLFHGTISDVGVRDYRPVSVFKFSDLVQAEADYAVVGHFHQILKLKRKGEKVIRGTYAGIPQGIRFSDQGEKGVLKVNIDGDKKEILFLPTARMKFSDTTFNCQGMKDEDEVISALSDFIEKNNLKNIPTRIVLKGSIASELSLNENKLEEKIKKDNLYIRLINQTLSEYNLDEIQQESSTRGKFVRTLKDQLEQIPDEEEEEREKLKLAIIYGLDAFSREEVDLRWK